MVFTPCVLLKKTGVTSADLELFWEALVKMWELDRSASRGMMAPPWSLCVLPRQQTGVVPRP